MRPVVYTTDELVRAFDEHRILTLEQVKGFLGTTVKMTALRKLRHPSCSRRLRAFYDGT